MVVELRLTFEVLTPLYLGGADQDAELRPPSIKGLLRYWWRAVNPRTTCSKNLNGEDEGEAAVFGGAGPGQGQSPFLLGMDSPLRGNAHWEKALVQPFDIKPVGKGDLPQNGLAYLGYPFPLQDKERVGAGRQRRKYIEPGQHLKLTCIFTRRPTPEITRGIAASAWFLGHFGGAGSRSRRGFGSLTLVDWQTQDRETAEEIKRFPLLHEKATPEAWMAGYDAVRRAMQEENRPVEGNEGESRHPHFGPGLCIVLAKKGYARGDWAACLDEMGLAMQRFRQRQEPDYSMVKAGIQGRGLLQRTPGRASFGLPLTFRFGKKSLDLVSQNGDRHGSLLHLRPVLIGNELYPLYLRLAGDVPGETPPGKVVRDHPGPLEPIEENAMDLFMRQLQGVIRHE